MASSPDAVLRAFILDYCSKKGLHNAAAGLRADAQSKGEPNMTLPGELVTSQNSFLSEWFGMFWNVFQSRVNPGSAAAVLAPRRPPPSQHHGAMPFATGAFPHARPPHVPSPQPPGLSQAQPHATHSSRSRAVAAASSRSSAPPSPYVSMDNQMNFALSADAPAAVQDGGVMDALGSIISPPGPARPSVAEIGMPRGAMVGPSVGAMHPSAQPHLRPPPQGHRHSAQNAAAIAYAQAEKRMSASAQEAYAMGSHRPGPNSAAHLQLGMNFREEEALAARRRAQAALPNSKKRSSVDAASPSSASTPAVPGAYPKMGPNGPKKRSRVSAPYSTAMSAEMEALQSQQIARGSSHKPATAQHPHPFPQTAQDRQNLQYQQILHQRQRRAMHQAAQQQSHDLRSIQAQAAITAQPQHRKGQPPPDHQQLMSEGTTAAAAKLAVASSDQIDFDSILGQTAQPTPAQTTDPFLMEMQNGSHSGIPTSRANPPARRASYPRSSNGSPAVRAPALSAPAVSRPDPLPGAPPAASADARRAAAAQGLSYPVAVDRGAKDSSSQRSGMYPRDIAPPAHANGGRENGFARAQARKGVDALEESMSAKSDRPPTNAPGGGTPSQRSIASAGSGERRTQKQTAASRRRSGGRAATRRRADRSTVGTVSPTAAQARRAHAAAADANSAAPSAQGGVLQAARQSPKGRDKGIATDVQRPAVGASKANARNGVTKKRAQGKGAKQQTKKQAQAQAKAQAQAMQAEAEAQAKAQAQAQNQAHKVQAQVQAQAQAAQAQAQAQAHAQLQPPASQALGGPKRGSSQSKGGAHSKAKGAAAAQLTAPPQSAAATPAKAKRQSKGKRAQRELANMGAAAAPGATAADTQAAGGRRPNGKMDDATVGAFPRALERAADAGMGQNHDIFSMAQNGASEIDASLGLQDFAAAGAHAGQLYAPADIDEFEDFLPNFEDMPHQ